MTDYTKLVEALRCTMKHEKVICAITECSYNKGKRCKALPYNKLFHDAAAAIEDLQAQLPKRGEMAEVVRCKDCVYYHKAHVKLDDGTELDYDSDVVKEYKQKRKESGDPFWEMVCADLGVNVGGRCERDNNQGYAEDKSVFRSETDFCSKAMAKMEVQE